LISLTVYGSINAQIPYLLRSVLPNGLPNLKSLGIVQLPSNSGENVNLEGALWYETEDGRFREAKLEKAGRDVLNGYIHSIARTAPNLEEIGLHSIIIGQEGFVSWTSVSTTKFVSNHPQAKIASDLACLSKIRRIYYTGPDQSTDKEPGAVLSNARTLAEACNGLSMIVNTGSVNIPYVVARISRTESGEVRSIDAGSGYGMQIGNEDEAFPFKWKNSDS
jgi:hypothetical protein